MADRLIVRGAREHNLRGVDLDLPRDSLIVFTGLSGSGKSSLAFDTIFAEGQRRYVESLSAYARQFLGQMDKPDVDFIEGLSPAVSIDQKSTNRNPRSTVAPSPRSTTTCVCCTPGPALRTARSVASRSPGRRRSRSSTRCWRWRPGPFPGPRARRAHPEGEFVDLFEQLTVQGYSPRACRRGRPPAVRSAEAEEAREARHRGRRRPPRRQAQRAAATHRLHRDRAAARRGCRRARLRRS